MVPQEVTDFSWGGNKYITNLFRNEFELVELWNTVRGSKQIKKFCGGIKLHQVEQYSYFGTNPENNKTLKKLHVL